MVDRGASVPGSTLRGTAIQTAMTNQGVAYSASDPQMLSFRNALVRGVTDLAVVIAALKVSRGVVFVSRKRIRHDALLMAREGQI